MNKIDIDLLGVKQNTQRATTRAAEIMSVNERKKKGDGSNGLLLLILRMWIYFESFRHWTMTTGFVRVLYMGVVAWWVCCMALNDSKAL
jgi:hypothetical protein